MENVLFLLTFASEVQHFTNKSVTSSYEKGLSDKFVMQ